MPKKHRKKRNGSRPRPRAHEELEIDLPDAPTLGDLEDLDPKDLVLDPELEKPIRDVLES